MTQEEKQFLLNALAFLTWFVGFSNSMVLHNIEIGGKQNESKRTDG